MKNTYVSILVFVILLGLTFCSDKGSENKQSEIAFLAGRWLRAINLSNSLPNRISIEGSVKGPGSISNAKVQVFPTPTNGKCVNEDGSVNGVAIATATSDASGRYTLSYSKTGSTLCVVVIPSDGSQIEVFSPTTKTRTPTAWSGTNSLMAIINEPPTTSTGGTKTANVTPFTRMAARRFSALSAINGGARVKSKVFYKVNQSESPGTNREKVELRVNTPASLLEKANDEVANSFFPKRNKSTFSLEGANPADPSYALRLGSIAILADKRGGGVANGSSTAEDFEKVINFMEEDFSDGRFNGKKIDPNTNQPVALSQDDLGGVVADANAADDFLSGAFKNALSEYDSYDDEFASTADDLFFCDADTKAAGCEFAVLAGSPPEMWVFDPKGDFLDANASVSQGSVGVVAGGFYGGTGKTGEFTIVNAGGTDLTITLPITFSDPRFSVLTQPSATVAPGDFSVFQVRFQADSVSSFTASTSITSNDTVQSPFPFSVTGSGEDLGTDIKLYWGFNQTLTNPSNFFFGANNDILGIINPTMDIFGNARAIFFTEYGAGMTYSGVPMTGDKGTFSAWVAPSDITNSHAFISQGSSPEFQLKFQNNSQLVFTTTTSAGTVSLTQTINPADFVGKWNLVTGVYDGATMSLYVNGVLLQSITQTTSFVSQAPFLIGLDLGTAYFQGGLDDVRVYRRALTSAQIQALYNQN